MCLGPEFFDARDAAIRTREARGHVEVEHFMESLGLDFDVLYNLGYFGTVSKDLDPRTLAPRTTDIFIHDLAPGAEAIFLQDRNLQLIFVRARKARSLAALLLAGKAFEIQPGGAPRKERC
jgi:hypothetical protein